MVCIHLDEAVSFLNTVTFYRNKLSILIKEYLDIKHVILNYSRNVRHTVQTYCIAKHNTFILPKRCLGKC